MTSKQPMHISRNKGINLKKMSNPQKNEQFPKYEKIVAIYYGDCIHAFKNFFRWEISENRVVFIYCYAQLVSYVGIAPKIQILIDIFGLF